MVTHQPGDPVAADVDVQAQPELGLHPWPAIGPTAAGMDLAELFAEIGVSRVGCDGGRDAQA